MKIRIGEQKEAILPEVVHASTIVKQNDLSTDLAKAVKKQLSTELSVDDLEAILKKEFPPTKIKKLLVDMTEAEDTKATKDGDFYQTPNWDARDKALSKILRLLRYIDRENGAVSDQVPTKIVFNVIQKQVNVDKKTINVEPAA